MRIALPATIAPDALAGCDPGATTTDLAGGTMGTRWSVRLVLPPRMTADVVRAAIEARLDGIVAEMSHWAPSSVLSRFNRSAAGQWTTLPPDFAHVMATGLAIAAQTGGAFDPAIGRLVDAWGFGPTAAAHVAHAIDAARSVSGWRRLTFSAPDRRLRQPGGLSLDLSGIAKGYAVDAVADLLGTMGIAHCLVEIGGELVGRGVQPGGMPWWVDLETPPGHAVAPVRIALHRIAVATSGDYRRGAHTIDPRTGRPTDNGVVSASVVAATALAADAWATALTVLGAVDGLALAARHAVAARIVTARDGATRDWITPALRAMIDDGA